jgi:hypothetical protein
VGRISAAKGPAFGEALTGSRTERCEDVHGPYRVSAERVIWRSRISLQEATHATTAFAARAACYA